MGIRAYVIPMKQVINGPNGCYSKERGGRDAEKTKTSMSNTKLTCTLYFCLLLGKQILTEFLSDWLTRVRQRPREIQRNITEPLSLRKLKSSLILITNKNTQNWECSKF